MRLRVAICASRLVYKIQMARLLLCKAGQGYVRNEDNTDPKEIKIRTNTKNLEIEAKIYKLMTLFWGDVVKYMLKFKKKYALKSSAFTQENI